MIINEYHLGWGFIHAYVTPGDRIELYTFSNGALETVKVFRVGDTAEYDSDNTRYLGLRYLGTIRSITAKSVAIRPTYGSSTKCLNFDTFSWRNWCFDLGEAEAYNSEVSRGV
jgi:hypothetical protein